MPLDETIRQVFALYHPGRCHGHQFWCTKLTCDVVKLLSKASIQKAQKEPSTQLIEATSCIKRSNAPTGAEELRNLYGYQLLKMDRNW
jgi:hypothetical protein